MSTQEITLEAKESLRKYFKDCTDVQHDYEGRQQLTVEQMTEMINKDIKDKEERLNELKMIQRHLEHDAKGALEFIFGKVEEGQPVHHLNVEETEEALMNNANKQLSSMKQLKQEYMNK